MSEGGEKESRAQQVAEHIKQAADELEQAAATIPDCNCAVLDVQQMNKVVADLGRAEQSAAKVHASLRLLQRQQNGGGKGLATLETQPLDGLPKEVHQPKALEAIKALAEDASVEITGGL